MFYALFTSPTCPRITAVAHPGQDILSPWLTIMGIHIVVSPLEHVVSEI